MLVFVVERVMENVMTCSIVQQIEVSTETSDRDQEKLSVVGLFLRLCLFARFMVHSYFPTVKHRTGDEILCGTTEWTEE
jgi:hypothetical protein